MALQGLGDLNALHMLAEESYSEQVVAAAGQSSGLIL